MPADVQHARVPFRLSEIEHRYGKGILEKLHEKAKTEYFKGKEKK